MSEIINRFCSAVGKEPTKTALIIEDLRLTYSDLAEQVRRLAGGLSSIGVKSGTHVAVLLHNSPEYVVTMLAAADLGATLVPLNPTMAGDGLATAFEAADVDFAVARHTVVKHIIQNRNHAAILPPDRCLTVGKLLDRCSSYEEMSANDECGWRLGERPIPPDTAYILTMTSGSTGAPKPIVFSQRTKIDRVDAAVALYNLADSDITLAATPIYHSLAQRLVLLPLLTGGTSVVLHGFTPRTWVAEIGRADVTFTIAVSSQLAAIISDSQFPDADMATLRTVVSSSALLEDSVKARLATQLGCEFHECYGASEIGIATNLAPGDGQSKLRSVGCACPGVHICIVDDEQNPVGAGVIGEIACRTPLAFLGYYKLERESQRCMVDAHFLTGDLGYLDNDGFLFFVGRKKELIITGGINVYPADVESALLQHPKVSECAVIGIPDSRLGEGVVAVVVAAPGSTLKESDLRRECVRRLADYQQPLLYQFVQELPRNSMGKVMKQTLYEEYAGLDPSVQIGAILRARP